MIGMRTIEAIEFLGWKNPKKIVARLGIIVIFGSTGDFTVYKGKVVSLNLRKVIYENSISLYLCR